MRKSLVIAVCITAGLLSACNALKPRHQLPTCDGKHRRPANPYGSVLVGEAVVPTPVAERDPDAEQPCGGGR